MRALDTDERTGEAVPEKPPANEEAGPPRRTRGGTSYQHSLSARGIKSSGRARSGSDEDVRASLERLERVSRRTTGDEEDHERRRDRAYGRHGGGRRRSRPPPDGVEECVRGPRMDW